MCRASPLVLAVVLLVAPAAANAQVSASPPAFEHVHALAFDAAGRTVWLGAHTGLYRSEDGGRTWTKASLPAHGHGADVMAIAPHPVEADVLYVGTHEAGALKTVDGGKTWVAVNSGLRGLDVHGLAIDPNVPAKLHALVREAGAGVYRTTDGGQKWVRVDDGPAGETKVLASVNIPTGMGGIFLYAGTGDGLQRNPDCFWGWRAVGGLPTGTVNGFAVDPTNPKVMLVAMRDGVFRSEDAGGRWTATRGAPKNAAAVTIDPRRPREAYAATTDGQVFVSRDGGHT